MGKSVLVSRRGCHAALVPPVRRLPLVPILGDFCSLGD